MNKKLYSVGLAALTLSAQAMQDPVKDMGFNTRMERAIFLSVQDEYYPIDQQQEYVEDDGMFAAIAASLQDQGVDDEYEKAIALSKQEYHEKEQEENDITSINDDLLGLIDGKGSVYDVMRLIAKGAQINVPYLAAIAASLQDVDKQEVDDEYEKAIALSNQECHEKEQEENDINCINDDLLGLIEGKGSVYDVMRLIAKGAQINVRYSDSLTPLMVAARENRPVICSLLIANGAQINTEDNKGNTPLDYAIGTNNSKLCKFFVERGADLNPTSDHTDISLLGRALLRECDFMLYKNLSNRGAKL